MKKRSAISRSEITKMRQLEFHPTRYADKNVKSAYLSESIGTEPKYELSKPGTSHRKSYMFFQPPFLSPSRCGRRGLAETRIVRRPGFLRVSGGLRCCHLSGNIWKKIKF